MSIANRSAVPTKPQLIEWVKRDWSPTLPILIPLAVPASGTMARIRA